MSLRDFFAKERTLAKEHGPYVAARNGLTEATMKALQPLARWKATPIWDTEWDVCLVLDACRWDLWKEVTDTVGYHYESDGIQHTRAYGCESAWSVGSASPEWISKTFARRYDQEVSNTAYVTANPFSAKDGSSHTYVDPDVFPLDERGFAHLDEVWKDAWPMTDDLATVDPAVLTERGFYAYQESNTDRVVVHYMQPHIPFKKHPEWSAGWDLAGFGSGGGRSKDIWLQARDGELPIGEVWNAYAANLEWVLESVERWITETDATILITSDHGNAMGELGQWSHPPGSANPYLRKVPWVVVDGVGDGPDGSECVAPPAQSAVDADAVESRLEALGYT